MTAKRTAKVKRLVRQTDVTKATIVFETQTLGMVLIELYDRDQIKVFDSAGELIGGVEHADFDEGEELGWKLIRLIDVRMDGPKESGIHERQGSRASA